MHDRVLYFIGLTFRVACGISLAKFRQPAAGKPEPGRVATLGRHSRHILPHPYRELGKHKTTEDVARFDCRPSHLHHSVSPLRFHSRRAETSIVTQTRTRSTKLQLPVVVHFAVGRALLPDKRRPRVAGLLSGISNCTTTQLPHGSRLTKESRCLTALLSISIRSFLGVRYRVQFMTKRARSCWPRAKY